MPGRICSGGSHRSMQPAWQLAWASQYHHVALKRGYVPYGFTDIASGQIGLELLFSDL